MKSGVSGAEGACHPWAAGPSLSMLLRFLYLPRTVARAKGPHSKEEEIGMKAQVFVGVDVSKRYLDVAFPEGIERVSNEPEGVSALAERLRKSAAALVVLEANGGYETGLVLALQRVNVPAAVVIRARRAILPAPMVGSPRRTRSMPASWRASVK